MDKGSSKQPETKRAKPSKNPITPLNEVKDEIEDGKFFISFSDLT